MFFDSIQKEHVEQIRKINEEQEQSARGAATISPESKQSKFKSTNGKKELSPISATKKAKKTVEENTEVKMNPFIEVEDIYLG